MVERNRDATPIWMLVLTMAAGLAIQHESVLLQGKHDASSGGGTQQAVIDGCHERSIVQPHRQENLGLTIKEKPIQTVTETSGPSCTVTLSGIGSPSSSMSSMTIRATS